MSPPKDVEGKCLTKGKNLHDVCFDKHTLHVNKNTSNKNRKGKENDVHNTGEDYGRHHVRTSTSDWHKRMPFLALFRRRFVILVV